MIASPGAMTPPGVRNRMFATIPSCGERTSTRRITSLAATIRSCTSESSTAGGDFACDFRLEIAFDPRQGELCTGFSLFGFSLVTAIFAAITRKLAKTCIDFREFRFLRKAFFNEAGNRLSLIADKFDLPIGGSYLRCGGLSLFRILLDASAGCRSCSVFVQVVFEKKNVLGTNGILGVLTAIGETFRKTDLLLARLFGAQAGQFCDQTYAPAFQRLEIRACLGVVKPEQGLANLDYVAFLHEQAIKNAAFEVADRLAFGINDHSAHCDRRASQIGGISPSEEPAERDADRGKACYDEAA